MTQNRVSFSEAIARAVIAEASRRGYSIAALGRSIGLSRNAMYSRTAGKTYFNTHELEAIQRVLGVSFEQLTQSARLGMAA